eukprot:5994225-Alexandrium_andersonii.AAC.1
MHFSTGAISARVLPSFRQGPQEFGMVPPRIDPILLNGYVHFVMGSGIEDAGVRISKDDLGFDRVKYRGAPKREI